MEQLHPCPFLASAEWISAVRLPVCGFGMMVLVSMWLVGRIAGLPMLCGSSGCIICSSECFYLGCCICHDKVWLFGIAIGNV